jgi:hypothetical protein
MEILLVQPKYISKYPPLGLMKISTYHKDKGDKISYVNGLWRNDDLYKFDKIFITSLFTYDIDIVIETIKYYQNLHSCDEIIVGGIAATLLSEKIVDETGIAPIKGVWKEVEFCPPDYSLFSSHKWGNHSFVFTSRGCPNKCPFCAVKFLEPVFFINKNWKEHINISLPYIMIHDNNIISAGLEHYTDVLTYLRKIEKPVTFDNGFDCRLFNEDHCKYLSKINLRTIRFAFDSMDQNGAIQRAVKLCIKHGIPKSKILVFILYNFRDTLDDALYRAEQVSKLGARPYAMRYIPLNAIDRDSSFSKGWDKSLCDDFFEYVNLARLSGAVDFQIWRKKWKPKSPRRTFRKKGVPNQEY